ncbi:hypothetical protein GCM10010399_39600 [Dactylosporangium fulvum]|uniref:Lipoprotein n=1 Tax=Dactylosporangium fulvum TaxID=53359 RepID=A0ABY5W0K1_9ACTN|nr:hypothetical protein [Dactylosporangium fulvum]UWP82965.1 hypothetical protein Dfulv_01240 [Dactylosporangium fulvum]
MRASRLFAVVVILVGAAGCSGDGSGDVAPKRWAQSVCTALAPWRTEIADLTTKAQQQLQTAKTAAQTKTNVVDLLAGAESASEKARVGVDGAGIPKVAGGDKIAAQFTASLSKARDAYGNAKRAVSALPTNDSKTFYSSVTSAFATLKEEYEQSAIDLAHVGQKDLQKAFGEVPECR